MEREKIKRILIQLLKEDEEFRYTVIGILTTAFVTKKELQELIAEIKKMREDFNKQMIELRKDFNERIASLEERVVAINERIVSLEERVTSLEERIVSLEERVASLEERIVSLEERVTSLEERIVSLEERSEETTRQILELRKDFRRLEISISAIGARWGILSEGAFRNALRGILEKWFGVKVKKWRVFDSEGVVYGHPSMLDADVVIKDKKHILIEIKSHVRKIDVIEILNIAKVYEKKEGIKPELVIVSPFVDEKARELAEIYKIQIYTPNDLL